jgi:hypothetical protein
MLTASPSTPISVRVAASASITRTKACIKGASGIGKGRVEYILPMNPRQVEKPLLAAAAMSPAAFLKISL